MEQNRGSSQRTLAGEEDGHTRGVPREAGHRTQGRTLKVSQEEEEEVQGLRAICQTADGPPLNRKGVEVGDAVHCRVDTMGGTRTRTRTRPRSRAGGHRTCQIIDSSSTETFPVRVGSQVCTLVLGRVCVG
ncbi:uncharacterized protein LOC127010637 [Drosophila biarmipes]|uniref:uncharacterized protein LOC127010637 n=1 Tax=Drosophila biarmipes TaxID=125945 RepID=UPI0021CD04AE|nr:uncharacterized protein LOC127010637 [Drosophila biarmipes]